MLQGLPTEGKVLVEAARRAFRNLLHDHNGSPITARKLPILLQLQHAHDFGWR
jgi:hypothetical protein